MAEWECVAGSTVLIPSAGGDHLHVVISDPSKYEGHDGIRCLLVGISTANDDTPYDKTCLLEVGDHEFINRTSYVRYNNAKFLLVESIYNNVESGAFIPKAQVSQETLQKITEGFYQSDRTKRKYKKLKSTQ